MRLGCPGVDGMEHPSAWGKNFPPHLKDATVPMLVLVGLLFFPKRKPVRSAGLSACRQKSLPN